MDGVKSWFSTLPPVSKWLFVIFLGLPVSAAVGLISIQSIYLDFSLVFKSFNLWRLLTAPCFISPLGGSFLFSFIFFYLYSTRLETVNYSGKSDDFLFLIIVVSIFNIIFGFLFKFYFLGSMTSMSLIYMYSRLNANSMSNFYGFFQFKTIYLPWILLVAGFLQSGRFPLDDFLAIVSGHIFFYLTDVYPKTNNVPPLIKTPRFITNLFPKHESNQNNQRIDPRTGRPTVGPTTGTGGGYNWGHGRALG